MLRCILSNPPKVRFNDVVAVQEGHFAIGFNPDLSPTLVTKTRARIFNPMYLVLGILGDVIQCCYVQLEFAAFAEFSKAGPEADKIRTGNRDPEAHRRLGNVVDLILLQSEAIRLVRAVDEMDKILSLRQKRSLECSKQLH